MPHEPAALPPSESLPDPHAVPAEVISDAEAAVAANPADTSAVKRLQAAIGANEQAVKARARRAHLLNLAKAGFTRKQIAKLLGVKENTVKVALWRARASGELNDLRDILAHDTTALAVDTVNHHLKKKNPSVAIEHLKGIGLYKNHSNVKNEGVPSSGLPPLQVNVVFQQAPGVSAPTPETFDVSEACVGVQRVDE